MVVLKHMLNFICMIHLTGVSVICLKALLTWQLGIMPVVLHCFLNWLCFYSFCSHEALEGHIQHLACCSFFKTYFCFRKKKETADIFFIINRWSVSLSVGQDYTQSNPELKRKQGQSSAWSSHHLCVCPGYWAALCFTPQIISTWAPIDLYKHRV